MARLTGKISFITGAGAGIAKATALAFAREGCKIGIAEINADLGRRRSAKYVRRVVKRFLLRPMLPKIPR